MKKIAIVCDWLTNFAGAERVILTLHELFPFAPIYTSIYNSKKCKGFEKADLRTSFLQYFPFSKNHHQFFLQLMPYAFEKFDLSEYDIVISSSHSCAKGVITRPETKHICYCHSPMRYLWDSCHEYLREYGFSWLVSFFVPFLLTKLRMWDRCSADRVDYFVANSKHVAKRIKEYYQRDSEIIYPFCDLEKFKVKNKQLKNTCFLALGRIIPYKKFDLLVETFNQNGLPLKIIGTGKDKNKLQKIAKENIEFLGYVKEKDLQKYYADARALLFPQLEDFGITPIEAMACGTPVIAFKAGGALETVNEKSGLFFDYQTKESLQDAIDKFIKKDFDPLVVRKQSEKFSKKIFEERILKLINNI
jgi:glycosyltransferase involved in cell wall biosynthesis